jgi:hypothetical protein
MKFPVHHRQIIQAAEQLRDRPLRFFFQRQIALLLLPLGLCQYHCLMILYQDYSSTITIITHTLYLKITFFNKNRPLD